MCITYIFHAGSFSQSSASWRLLHRGRHSCASVNHDVPRGATDHVVPFSHPFSVHHRNLPTEYHAAMLRLPHSTLYDPTCACAVSNRDSANIIASVNSKLSLWRSREKHQPDVNAQTLTKAHGMKKSPRERDNMYQFHSAYFEMAE